MSISPLKISPDVHQALRAYSKRSGRTQNWIASTAILKWLREQPDFEEPASPKPQTPQEASLVA